MSPNQYCDYYLILCKLWIYSQHNVNHCIEYYSNTKQ